MHDHGRRWFRRASITGGGGDTPTGLGRAADGRACRTPRHRIGSRRHPSARPERRCCQAGEGGVPAVTAPHFVHLHVHTEYSMLDGAARLKDMFAECKRLGMPAVAITDHGNLHGAYDFFTPGRRPPGSPRSSASRRTSRRSRGAHKRTVQWGQPHQKRDDVSGGGGYTHKTIWARERDGPAQPLPALLARLRRGLLRKWPRMDKELHRRVRRGPDRLHRLPVRRGADPAAPRPVRRGAQGRRRATRTSSARTTTSWS